MRSRKNLFATVSGGALIVLTCIAFKTTLALNRTAQRRLLDLESTLRISGENAAKSIDNLFARSDSFAIRLARQQQPRGEWFFVLEELIEAHQGFLANSRYESVLPYHTATSRLFLARLLILKGNRNTAQELLEKSIELATTIQDQATIAKAKNTLGCLVAADGDYRSAYAAFKDCSTILEGVEGLENVRAIAMRNMGLVERALGGDGITSVRKAVSLLERAPETASWGLTNELLQDLRMTLCEMNWSLGKIDEAAELARQTQDDLTFKLIQADLPMEIDKHALARNRGVTAQHFVQRNLGELRKLLDAERTDSRSERVLGKTVSRWQWNTLFDLATELVSVHLPVSGTMVAEFEPQAGLVVAWSTLDFNHSVVIEIAKATYDRTQLVVVVDLEESLDEARSALESAGVPLNRIRFGISDCEAPWFRDDGPIVSRSSTGDMIWFDSRLTRDDRMGRTVLDALPTTLRRNWKTRVADIPIHVEGGMLLSNGKGLTIGAATIAAVNHQYGFSDDTIARELRRITGAKNWQFVDTLIGERTEHVDLFLTFVSPTTVVVGDYDNPKDPNTALLDEIAMQLGEVVLGDQPLKVVRMPMPRSEEPYFPSYTNVVFANGILLVPSYDGEPKEAELKVKQIYESLLPDWEVRFINCSRLKRTGGALHCLVSNLGDTPFTPVYSPKQ